MLTPMLVGAAGLLLTAWIIGLVFEIPSRWMHVLPVMALLPMVVHVIRTAPSQPPRRH